MSDVFRTSRRMEFADTDLAGIVHFANFFRFMEVAELDFLRTRGLSFSMDWEGRPMRFPRVSASCDYLRPAYFEDVLDISVRVENLGRKSVTYAFEFFRGKEPVARGRLSTVCCRIGEGNRLESHEIPAEIREKLS